MEKRRQTDRRTR